MAIHYHPKEGAVFYCDFAGNMFPEMVKKRFVVVISPHFISRGDLCTVVPLSRTPPPRIENFHHVLEKHPCPAFAVEGAAKVWAKCDLAQTVSFARLTGYYEGKKDGKRNYVKLSVSDADLLQIKKCVLYSLGLGGLTKHIV